MKKSTVYGVMAAICVCASGCDQGVDQSTPQGVAESFQNAAKNGNWSTAFQCLTDESQEMLLLPVAFAGAFAKLDENKDKAKEINEILEKHGLDLEAKEDGFKNVTDKGALFGDFIAWTEKYKDENDNSDDMQRKITEVKFENFKIDGNTATCDSGKHQTHFTKTDGKWYIDFKAGRDAKRKEALNKIREQLPKSKKK